MICGCCHWSVSLPDGIVTTTVSTAITLIWNHDWLVQVISYRFDLIRFSEGGGSGVLFTWFSSLFRNKQIVAFSTVWFGEIKEKFSSEISLNIAFEQYSGASWFSGKRFLVNFHSSFLNSDYSFSSNERRVCWFIINNFFHIDIFFVSAHSFSSVFWQTTFFRRKYSMEWAKIAKKWQSMFGAFSRNAHILTLIWVSYYGYIHTWSQKLKEIWVNSGGFGQIWSNLGKFG